MFYKIEELPKKSKNLKHSIYHDLFDGLKKGKHISKLWFTGSSLKTYNLEMPVEELCPIYYKIGETFDTLYCLHEQDILSIKINDVGAYMLTT
tara:strand:- start:5117 stop:5395 length:279 start_codon:yes stop_codon:yes gene_type:complete